MVVLAQEKRLYLRKLELHVNINDPSIAAPVDQLFAVLVASERYEGALQRAEGICISGSRSSKFLVCSRMAQLAID